MLADGTTEDKGIPLLEAPLGKREAVVVVVTTEAVVDDDDDDDDGGDGDDDDDVVVIAEALAPAVTVAEAAVLLLSLATVVTALADGAVSPLPTLWLRSRVRARFPGLRNDEEPDEDDGEAVTDEVGAGRFFLVSRCQRRLYMLAY